MASLLGPVNSGNSINIRRDVQDAFYRYKMPRLQSKIEGKGNGIKTVVPNMVEIAKALHRPPAYITKFFGAELGALSNCDEKAAKYIVNGAHDADKLQTLLDVFIQKFVLCTNCENPETLLSVSKKDGTIYRTCQACGTRSTVDMLHKLVSFIRANPPPKPAKKSQAKDRADAATDMASKMTQRVSSPLAAGDGSLEQEQAIEGMIASEDFDDSIANVVLRADDEEDWDEETAAALRHDELSCLSESVRQKLALGDNNKKDEADHEEHGATLGKPLKAPKQDDLMDSLDAFGDLLAANEHWSNEKILDEIRDRQIRSDNAIAVLVQVLFKEDLAKTLKIRQSLLKQLLSSEKDEKALLGSVERLVGVVDTSLLPKISMILQSFYNNDLLSDDALFAWREKPSKRYVSKEVGSKVREHAKPFFDWLQTAESGDEDDSDEEE